MMNDNTTGYFQLFQCCLPVKGVSRSSICDVQRGDIYFIPNALYKILNQETILNLKYLVEKYGEDNESVLEGYFKFLIDNELIFTCYENEVSLFPKIKMKWKSPFQITNAIIDIDKLEELILKELIQELDLLGCQAIQIRIFKKMPFKKIHAILKCFNDTGIQSIYVLLERNKKNIQIERMKKFIDEFQRLVEISIHSSEKEEEIWHQGKSIKMTLEILNTEKCCGKILPIFFSSNLQLFSESKFYNSCLNRKISIDTHGNIKNCPSMPQSYGNIQETTLAEALKHPDFKKYWNINKDQIEVCKDCEFRYICTDCRAYIEDPENMYSKPLKCGYNPYTAEWEEWSTNPLKQKAIAHYGMEELVKK